MIKSTLIICLQSRITQFNPLKTSVNCWTNYLVINCIFPGRNERKRVRWLYGISDVEAIYIETTVLDFYSMLLKFKLWPD